jgi:hypothetical protein
MRERRGLLVQVSADAGVWAFAHRAFAGVLAADHFVREAQDFSSLGLSLAGISKHHGFEEVTRHCAASWMQRYEPNRFAGDLEDAVVERHEVGALRAILLVVREVLQSPYLSRAEEELVMARLSADDIIGEIDRDRSLGVIWEAIQQAKA